ncbi:MAG: sulfatase [Candidatus Omnitrophota bacterium]
MKILTDVLFAKRVFLLVCCFFVLGTSSYAGEARPRHKNTNVIFIGIDTLRNDHLGCYGYRRKTSKNIDSLAKKAVLFNDFIVQAYLTPVSQMSIFSAQYPKSNGVVSFQTDSKLVIPPVLPDIFKIYGYTNAAFLGSPEFFRQYQDRDGKINDPGSIFSRSFDIYQPSRYRVIPDQALTWIKMNKSKKFFLWLPLGTVHWPYSWRVPEPHKSIFDTKGYEPFFKVGSSFINNKQAVPAGVLSRIYQGYCYGDSAVPYKLKKEDVGYIISRYDAGIHYTDQFIGKLMSVLKESGLLDRTLIVLYSVHGEDLGEHGYFSHYDIYDTEVKNALMIKFPGGKFKGKKIDFQVQGVNIVPTILDYLDIPAPHESQGHTLMPLIERGKTEGLSPYAYMIRIPLWEDALRVSLVEDRLRERGQWITDAEEEFFEKYKTKCIDYYRLHPEDQYPLYDIGIRTKDWKLILRRNKAFLEEMSWWGFVSKQKINIEPQELYDLKKDPYEQVNVADQHPEIVDQLKKPLLKWDEDMGKRMPKAEEKKDPIIIPYP